MISSSEAATHQELPLILVVDDDQDVRFLLRATLEREGYAVEEAGNGRQALSAFDRLRPDVVLLDILMPGIDGFDTCIQMRALPGGDRTPILMISALDDAESVNRAFEAGATDYITKPIHMEVLRGIVRRLLRARRAESQRDAALEALQESRADLKRSYQALTDRVGALEALHRIGVAISSQLETKALLQFIVEQAVKLMDAVGCSILLPDEATGELVFQAAVDQMLVGMRIPSNEGIGGRVLRERAPQVIHDVTADPDHYASIGLRTNIPSHSMLAVPLLIGDRAIGVLEAIDKRKGIFTDQDRDLLMTMASHAAIAIENARLYEETRHRMHEATLIQEVMLATASTFDFDLALERTVKALHRALGVDCLGFLLPDEQEGTLVSHPSLVGFAEGAFQIPIKGSLAGQAYSTGQPVMVQDLTQGPACFERTREVRSVLAVPVRIGDRVAAMLHAESPQGGAFGEDELRLFTTIAGQMGVSLENAQLHERVQRHAVKMEERLRRRTFDLQVLHDLSREIGLIQDLDELVDLMLANLQRAIPHDVLAGITVSDIPSDRASDRSQYQLFIQPARPLTLTVQDQIRERLVKTFVRMSGREIASEQELLSIRTLESEESDSAQLPVAHLDSVFQVPLTVGQEGGIVGLFFVGAEQEEAFTEHHVRLLYTMSNQASLFLSIRRSEHSLEHRAELEKLVADISTIFVHLPPEDLDGGIDFALRAIGGFAAADRSYVFVLSDNGTKMDNSHEWCAEGIASQIENRNGLPVERFPWWMNRVNHRFEATQIPLVADLPSEAKAEKELFESQGVQSLVVVPMAYGGSLMGFIGIDSVRVERVWTEDTIALLGIVGDIFVNALERKRAAEQILAALEEKEVLLKEIHHRVKNNLQVISSLLDLQSKYIEDEGTRQMFKESRSRVKSMALIHDRLYRAKDLAKIDFGEYVQSLVRDLFRSYRLHAVGVTLKLNVEEVFLGVDTAVPCGLVINELISNALKYAFPNGRRGEICVELFSENGAFTLVVRDNGVGFPKELDFRNVESLGLRLVVTLVKQLKGSIELQNDGGTKFKVEFAALERKRRGMR